MACNVFDMKLGFLKLVSLYNNKYCKRIKLNLLKPIFFKLNTLYINFKQELNLKI